MMRKRNCILPVLLAMAALNAHSEEGKELDSLEGLRSLLSSALMKVTISTRVLLPDAPPEDKPIWNAESSKLTLPGRSIKVRLDGDNVRIYLICTPYVQENGEILLLAQGQVWFSAPTEKEVKYSSTFYSIPVSFGEKILFFPLGLSEDEKSKKDFVNIELEIRIFPYANKE